MSNFNKSVVDYVSFSNTALKYEYDDKTNTLKVVGQRDLQEEINENLDCGLEAIIEKFGFIPQSTTNSFVDGEGLSEFYDDPKDKISRQFDLVEDIRERYSLPIDISDEALRKFILEESSYLKGQMDILSNTNKDSKSINDKGGESDEKA